ncbi:hypothetical protein RvY_10171 [Ramazzottius varieornatus]|uniref:Cadherin domain-containing protein n=1 Tax=Ramazzottius varieornatus TaxID=947166 RepID=A0A1D1VH88_RAMVA|nr:hypothetical protein RvY_10171 [Ramazzottius varieornatus]
MMEFLTLWLITVSFSIVPLPCLNGHGHRTASGTSGTKSAKGGSAEKNVAYPIAIDAENTSWTNAPGSTLGDLCTDVGKPCDVPGSICFQKKEFVFGRSKAESNGRCRCRHGYVEVRSTCNRPPIFMKAPYKFTAERPTIGHSLGYIRAKDFDGNPFEVELDTTEFNISSTGEVTTTKTYSSSQTISFSAVATDSFGLHASVPVTVNIWVPPGPDLPLSTVNAPIGPFNNFCELSHFSQKAPESSAFLTGPYQLYQTYLLFSGPCVLEYIVDWNDTAQPVVRVQVEPEPIAEYFNLTVIDAMRVSVLSTFSALSATSDMFILNILANVSNKMVHIRCSTDPSLSSRAVVGCQEVELDGHSRRVLLGSRGRASTSQHSIGDGQIYHYVVNSNGTEIALMDSNFTTAYQETSGFLRLHPTRMRKILAIQLVQDQLGNSDDRNTDGLLAVFALGGVNKTEPYVAFANLPLSAKPDLPLAPVSWVGQPVSLIEIFTSNNQ